MKIINKIWGIALLMFTIALAVPKQSAAQNYDDEITFQTFYDELEPYGTWLYDPKHGDVWVPDVDPDFRPYATNGHWVVTEYGNTWVSDYDWGWAPFHYGRWIFDDFYGWEWVPGYEWGPAWVSWRESEGYYGWAPMQPGITVDMAFGNDYYVPDNYWVFAPQAYIGYPNIYNYYVPRARVSVIIRSSNWIRNDYRYDNRRYIIGPRYADIQRVSRTRVPMYNIGRSTRPGRIDIRNNTVNIYRPNVRQVNYARPARVVDARSYREANPNNRLVGRSNSRGNTNNGNTEAARTNRRQFADFARNASADNKFVRFNRPEQPRTDRQPTPVSRPGQPEMRNDRVPTRNGQTDLERQNAREQMDQMRRRRQEGQTQPPQQQTPEQQEQRRQQWEQQRQQREQQRGQMTPEQQEQQRQQWQQQRQQREQQRQQQTPEQQEQRRQQYEQQRQQREQQRQQQTPEQQEQRRQQYEQQRQQREQQRQQQGQQVDQQQQEQRRQQYEQQRQQREQQRQQQDQQQRQQADQQQQEQRRQQMEQQRQQREQQRQQQDDQQRQQREQQMQQQREQQRQQMDQQRQQQAEQQRQQQDAQRQQQEQQRQQQREQQRQQQDAQRQQQAEQQRQQQQQQQQQQQERRQRPPRPF